MPIRVTARLTVIAPGLTIWTRTLESGFLLGGKGARMDWFGTRCVKAILNGWPMEENLTWARKAVAVTGPIKLIKVTAAIEKKIGRNSASAR